MIGGIVTETIALADRIWIDCEEKQSTSKCAIYVKRDNRSERIKPGDTVWWQGVSAYWTPFVIKDKKRGIDYDIRLERIGCSGVKRPAIDEAALAAGGENDRHH